jgi:hypothetical protein
MEEVNKLSEMDERSQKRVVDLILNQGELSLSLAFNRLVDEERDRLLEEAREKRRQMEEQARVKREEDAASERERLRIAHEERVKQENERLAREREEQEKRRLAEIERQKVLAEERAKNEAERERIRKENEELERIELAKMEEHFKRLQELKQKKLEEQKRAEEEKIKQSQVEKEKRDKEKIEQEVKKVEIPPTPYDQYIKCAKVIMGEITLNACKKSGTRYVVEASEEYPDDNTLNKSWSGKVWLDILGAKSDSKCYIDKVITGYLNGNITDAFVIARNDTGSEWFKQIANKANAVVFPANGELKNYVLIYFGNSAEVFMNECVKFGWGTTLNK